MRIIRPRSLSARSAGTTLLILLCGSFHSAAAQATSQAAPPGQACAEFNRKITAQVEAGQLKEAELALSRALASVGLNPPCDWIILQNMGVVMSLSGRFDETEAFAARAVALLERNVPPDDNALLRPLHMLASARLQQGKIAAAREAFQRMQRIPVTQPVDRAMFHGTAAGLLQSEGLHSEAEPEYRASIEAWEQAGRGDSSDLAATLNGLGDLYLTTGRIDDAGRVFGRALAIYATAINAGTIDHIRILNSQAVLYGRLGQWRKAEANLRVAVSLADATVNPFVLEPLLSNYAYALRMNHQTKEARIVEARASFLSTHGAARSIVDATELLAESKKVRK